MCVCGGRKVYPPLDTGQGGAEGAEGGFTPMLFTVGLCHATSLHVCPSSACC